MQTIGSGGGGDSVGARMGDVRDGMVDHMRDDCLDILLDLLRDLNGGLM
jgi:hypothetical protein